MARNAVADAIRAADKRYAHWSFYHRVDARIGALGVNGDHADTLYPLGWLITTNRVSFEFCERIMSLSPLALAKMADRVNAEHAGQCVRHIADAWKHAIAPEHFAAPEAA